MEQGERTTTEVGSPQGATVSPLLDNICLHYALDLWVQQRRRRHGHGDIIIVRCADDFVLGVQHGSDARRFLQDLRERLGKFRLELHPEKTRLLRFGRFASSQRKEPGEPGAPQTFSFLGLTDCCSRSRNGKFLLLRHTMRARLTAKFMRLLLSFVVDGMTRLPRKASGWELSCADITRTTACRPISRRSMSSAGRSRIAGGSRFGDAASAGGSTGRGWIGLLTGGLQELALFIPGRKHALLSKPEIRAQCGNSARWDLYGGRSGVFGCHTVPTATPQRTRIAVVEPDGITRKSPRRCAESNSSRSTRSARMSARYIDEAPKLLREGEVSLDTLPRLKALPIP
jgi:hypothetical protein